MAQNRKSGSDLRIWLAALFLAVALQFPIIGFLLHAPGTSDDHAKQLLVAGSRPMVLVPAPPKAESELKGQVVNLPKPKTQTAPPVAARHLAQHNHRTIKEQKARIRSTRKPIASKKQIRAASKIQSEASNSRKRTRIPEKRARPHTSVQTPATAKSGELANKIFQRHSPGGMVFPKIPATYGDYRMQTLTNRGSADDALIHVRDQGDETLLNARKFRFWAFFQRLKDQVRPHWTPNEALRRRDPTGRAFCCSDRLSVLHVVLDGKGALLEISTQRSSGLRFLDRVAELAFRRAQPFPNPPAELLESDRLDFEFGFLLEFRDGMPMMKWVPPQHL